jgi:cell division protein FtsL
MIRLSLSALLLAPTLALAQQPQPSLYDQLNAASADVTTIMANLRSAVIQGQNQIAALNTKIEALTKERDELKAAAAKPAEPAK